MDIARPYNLYTVQLRSLQQIMLITGQREFCQTGCTELTDVVNT